MERVVVVGGGVLGTMHAVAARRRGLDVLHIEREPEPRGASVRNFGLIWVSGRAAGPELSLALRARAGWEELAADVPGLGFRPHGSLTLASSEAELQLLKEAAALPDAPVRGYELIDAAAAREVNPALRGEFAGALRCSRDAIVEPRLALRALREHLLDSSGRRVRLAARPRGNRDRAARGPRPHRRVAQGRSRRGLHRGGLYRRRRPAPGGLRAAAGPPGPAADAADTAVRRPPHHLGGRRRLAALLPGLRPAGPARLPPQEPAAASVRAQLLLVQRLDGSLTIGDTHSYDEPFAFDVDEDAYDHLRGKAEKLLGTALPRTQRRWAGVYSQVTGTELYHRSQIAPGVVLVTGPGGRGMTCSPAIAEETFA